LEAGAGSRATGRERGDLVGFAAHFCFVCLIEMWMYGVEGD
jgi:hypothetical protein